MLQKLNERIQGVVAWVIVSLIAVTFALFGVDSYLQARHTSAVEAEVNGEPISKQALDIRYRRVRHEQGAAGKITGTEKQLKQELLNSMIASQVNVNAAHHYGFGVDHEQVSAAIYQIPQLQKDGHFSPERYEQVLNNALFTSQSFQKEMQQGMLLNQQHFAFLGTAFALPSEVKQFVKLYGQTRDYRYLHIPTRSFINNIHVSDDEINAYYAAHKHDFLAPEQVKLAFVRLSMAAVREKLKPSERDLHTYYDNNQGNYMAPARWKVRHVLFNTPAGASEDELQAVKKQADRVYHQLDKAPHTFVAQSKALTTKQPKAVTAGVLPWIVAGESPLDAELIQLTTPEQMLPPIKTEAGYELFQLQAYEPAKIKLFTEIQAEIREHWLAEHAQADYARLQEELSDHSYQMPDSLKPVSEALGLSIESTASFSREGGHDPVTSSPRVLKAAFTHDVLVLGNNSAPIQLDDDAVIVLRVKKHIPSREKSLAEVKTEIKDALMHAKATARAEAVGQSLQKNKQSAFMEEAVLLQHHLAWKTVTQATRESSLAPVEVNDLAFTLPASGRRSGLALGSDAAYVVVELNAINDGKLDMLDAEQLQSISQQIAANYGTIDYELYTSNLLEQAHVVKH